MIGKPMKEKYEGVALKRRQIFIGFFSFLFSWGIIGQLVWVFLSPKLVPYQDKKQNKNKYDQLTIDFNLHARAVKKVIEAIKTTRRI